MSVRATDTQMSSYKIRSMACALLESVTSDHDVQWGSGEMTPSAYDTAWVAMVRDPHKPEELFFPFCFDWLVAHQAMDGSWGSPFPYTIVPTLASLLALLKYPNETKQLPYHTKQIQYAAWLAENYLHNAFNKWSVTKYDTIGFEVLVPGILKQLEELGINFEFPAKNQLLKLYAEKLLIAGPELIYSGQSNLIFSLEAFGPRLDFERLKKQQAVNGNYGCSPSATAAVLIYGLQWDEQAANWLKHLYLDRNTAPQRDKSNEKLKDSTPTEPPPDVGSMPNAHSIDTFESGWVLYNLASAGFNFETDFPKELTNKIINWLQDGLTSEGISFGRFVSGVPTDSDDTGVVLAALNTLGVTTSINPLLHFERADYFTCFERERGVSITANAHTLAALVSVDELTRRTLASSIEKIINFLYGIRNSAGFWVDKWHLSPYYATVCSTMALAKCSQLDARLRLAPTLSWVLDNQSSRDGGWGAGDFSTLEETAYALQILEAAPDVIAAADQSRYERAIQRGAAYLWKNLYQYSPTFGKSKLPKLWLGKEPYAPSRVVFSAVLAALNHPLANR